MPKAKILNAQEVARDEEGEHLDARYDQPLAKVITPSSSSSWQVKEWPMLEDGDDKTTNALGYPFDYFRKKRIQERETIEQERKAAADLELQKQKEAEQAEAENAEKVTAAQLEELRQAAENEGREAGLKSGYDEGLAKGLQEGRDKGHEEGFKKGHDEGVTVGHDEGFTQGFNEGHALGLSQGESVITEQSERFRALADALVAPLRNIDEEVAIEVVRLATQLFKTLAGRELRQDPEFLKRSMLNALSHLPIAKRRASIFMHPDDLMVVETAMGRDYIKAQNWDLKPDESLKSGELTVSDGCSEIRSSLDERIQALVDEFLQDATQKPLEQSVEENSTDTLSSQPLSNAKDLTELQSKPNSSESNEKELKSNAQEMV